MNRIPTLITLAALTLPITNLYAQDNPDRQRPDRAQRRDPGPGGLATLKSALAALTLTDDQKSKSEEILKSAGERLDKARQEMAAAQGGDRRQAAQQFAQVARAATEEITALLDEDQKALFNQKLQESRQRQGPRDGERGPGPRDGDRGGGGSNPPSFARNLEQASTSLQLTDEQKQKVRALSSDVATKTQALHEEALKQLKTILSEEQFQQFQQMGPGEPALAGGDRRQEGRAGPGVILERLRTALSQLELTDDQKVKIKPAMESFEKKMQELRASLQGRPGPELRDKFRQHTQELRAELQSILTPEQLERVRDVLQPEGGRRPGAAPGAPNQRPARPRRPHQQ